jgi:hypothetical protein
VFTNEDTQRISMAIRFRRALIIMVGLAVLLGSFSTIAGAQEGLDWALKQATLFLSKQIGRPIPSVDNYTYELVNFPDAGLGCPEAGKAYPPKPTQAYKFVITISGISYEVHTTLDGSRSVLCSNVVIKQDVTLSTYRSPLFSIAYPNRWNFVDRGSDIFFGLSATPVCSQPGMTVTALGSVETDRTADRLLDEYAKSTPGVKLAGERTNIGNIGRSVTYVAPCADGTPRQTRVTIFLAYGRAYRVLQFAPQGAFDQWADVFLQILRQFSPGTAGGSSGSGQAMGLPDVSPLAMVAHVFAGNIFVGTLTDLPGLPITTDAGSDRLYRNVAVSPLGNHLVFVDPVNAVLFVAATAGGETPRRLAEKIVVSYPPVWSPDGGEVAYLIDEGATDGERAVYSLIAARADGSGSRKLGVTQGVRIGCSSATAPTDPAEQLYWSEVGFGGNEPLLAWSRAGAIYYSLGCDGIGVGQITGSSGSLVHPELRRARLSPDGSELLGLIGAASQPPTLARINPQERSTLTITTKAAPDQVAWSADGKTIFYSSAAVKETITLDGDSQRETGLKVFGVWPFETTIYDVALHRIDLATNADTEIYNGIGRAVGHIAPSPDGSGVLFTLIQSASNLVEAFKNNVSDADLKRQAPNVLLYWLPLPGGQAQLLAVTMDPIWGPIGSGAAPTPTSSARQATSPARPTRQPTPSALPPATNTPQPNPVSTGS